MPFETISFNFNIINLTTIFRWAELSFFALIWRFIINGGWVFFVILIFTGVAKIKNYQTEMIKEKNTQYILLAINVPKENPHGPEVTERLFAHLATAGSTKGLKQGDSIFSQPRFSFEIISLGGRIQFLVRTPLEYRDLVESAFYAEYPNVEIYEVDDYTKEAPAKFPHFEYDLWGAEIVLYNQDPYPIRTYPSFEHSLSGEFKDPISNILEVLNRIREGEQVWLQILITFGGLAWKKRGESLVNKLIGKRPKEEKVGGLADLIYKLFVNISNLIYDTFFGGEWTTTSAPTKEAPPSLISFLSPGEKDVVAAIQRKISKIGFRTKIRIIYLAKKEVYDVHRAIPGLLGALNQFNILDMNGFKPDDEVKTVPTNFSLFPTKSLIKKQNEILRAYKERSLRRGTNGYILNTEELATIYHLPITLVEVPLVKRTGSKKGEPPFALPVKETF